MKKLTITLSEDVYEGLYAKIGPRKISRFIDRLARAHVLDREIAAGYAAMAGDEAREAEAEEWTSRLLDEAR